MGKTALALNFLVNAAIKQNITTAMFSVEMPAEQLMQRMISAQSGVNGDKIRGLDLTDKDWTKIDVAANQLSKAKIFVDDTSAIKLGDLIVKARKLKSLHDDLGLIVIDYLQIVKGSEQSRKEGSQQEITEISQGLKAMARELNVPVIALSQLSRDNEKRDNKRPMLSDLRGSGAIEQDADLVMFIYREDYFDNQKNSKDKKSEEETKNNGSSGIAEVSISKHRNGATGVVKLVFLKEYGLFSNYSKVEE
jgi:replicative DNA helicase